MNYCLSYFRLNISRFVCLTLLSTFLFTFSLQAQVKITGQVVEADTKKPIPYASVYFDKTTVGVSTDQNGFYKLESDLQGKYKLISSFVGFKPASRDVILKSDSSYVIDFSLKESVDVLDQVVIKAKKDKDWNRKLERFKNYFLGESSIANKSEIKNVEVLEFEENERTFKAVASAPLEIENIQLGYKINYDLVSFSYDKRLGQLNYKGYIRYQNIQTKTSSRKIEQRRRDVYEGSMMHLLRSLISKKQETSDFVFYLENKSLNEIQVYPKKDLISMERDGFSKKASENNDNYLSFKGIMRVEYVPRTIDEVHGTNFISYPETSWIMLTKSRVEFGDAGVVYNPTDVVQYGAFAKKRLSETLPIDYKPNGESQRPTKNTSTQMMADFSQNVKEYNSFFPKERVFLDLENSRITPGKTLAFKATVVKGSELVPTDLSKTLYVELLNQKGELIKYVRVRVDKGIGRGKIVIPNDAPIQQMALRSYTNWMKNFDSNFFYYSPLSRNSTTSTVKVEFYPESGALLNNIKTDLAVRLASINGDGIEATYTIYNEKDQELYTQKTNQMGWSIIESAKFKSGKEYYAKIDGRQEVYVLPTVQESGVSFEVIENQSDYTIQLRSSKLNTEASEGFLIVESRGLLQYILPINVSDGNKEVTLSKSILQEGISVISYYYSNAEKVAQRAIYQRPTSVSAIGQTQIDEEARNFFLIASDLKNSTGLDVTPYLQDKNISDESFEGLLMSDYWMTLDVQSIAKGTFPQEEYNIEQGITFSGKISAKNMDKLLANKEISLLIKNSNPSIANAPIGDDGKFEFKDVNFNDTTELVFSITGYKGDYNIKIDSTTYEFVHTADKASQKYETKLFSPLSINDPDIKILDPVVVEGEESDDGSFGGLGVRPTYEFNFDSDDTDLGNTRMQGGVLTFLTGRIPGAIVQYDPATGQVSGIALSGVLSAGLTRASSRDSLSFGQSSGAAIPLFIVDNVPVEIQNVSSIDPADVANIQVITGASTAIYGSRGAAGVVIIRTRTGASFSSSANNASNTVVLRLKGYSVRQ